MSRTYESYLASCAFDFLPIIFEFLELVDILDILERGLSSLGPITSTFVLGKMSLWIGPSNEHPLVLNIHPFGVILDLIFLMINFVQILFALSIVEVSEKRMTSS